MEKTKKDGEGGGFFSRIFSRLKESFGKRATIESTVWDVAIFVISLIIARCHVIFGSHPLSIAFICVLPERVLPAVLGGALGSLTLGKSGIILALISVIVAFLRLIISGTDKSDGAKIFHERLLYKLASAGLGGLIAGAYELLLTGFTLNGIMYGVSMTLLAPAVVFLLSGLFDSGVTFKALLYGAGEVFSLKSKSKEEKYNLIFFECSALFAIFLFSLSLKEYELLGISAGYLFSAIITIFTARRFGAIRGGAVGFASSVGLSASFSVAFLLAGLGVGISSSLGIVVSVVVGAVAVVIWGFYSGGLVGMLSLFPEYAVASAVAIPLFKGAKTERTTEEVDEARTSAEDMVGTMALSYKSRYSGALDTLEGTFSSIAALLRRARNDDDTVTESEALHLVNECVCRYFDNSTDGDSTRSVYLEDAPRVAAILYKSKSLTAENFNTPPHLSGVSSEIAEAINRAIAILREEKWQNKNRDGSAEDYEYISKLINEARLADESEKSLNRTLSDKVVEILTSLGITGSSVQVYGERRPYFIIATEDEDGRTITSPDLRLRIETDLGVRLGAPEYFRRGKMALMQCGSLPRLEVEYGSRQTEGGEVSGDSAAGFTSREGCHFSVIADGEGRGREARRTSQFVLEFLGRSLEFGRGCEASLRLLNSTVKRRRSFTSSTVDIFSLDLFSGEATFFKCGAAPSYIKRGTSLFRIRSKTSPIGPLSELDAERIRVECLPGDYVIMFSDGVSADGHDAPWLIEFLAKPTEKSSTADSLAADILALAKKHSPYNDDMTVSVTKVK